MHAQRNYSLYTFTMHKPNTQRLSRARVDLCMRNTKLAVFVPRSKPTEVLLGAMLVPQLSTIVHQTRYPHNASPVMAAPLKRITLNKNLITCTH